jgi:hypothetical protein
MELLKAVGLKFFFPFGYIDYITGELKRHEIFEGDYFYAISKWLGFASVGISANINQNMVRVIILYP